MLDPDHNLQKPSGDNCLPASDFSFAERVNKLGALIPRSMADVVQALFNGAIWAQRFLDDLQNVHFKLEDTAYRESLTPSGVSNHEIITDVIAKLKRALVVLTDKAPRLVHPALSEHFEQAIMLISIQNSERYITQLSNPRLARREGFLDIKEVLAECSKYCGRHLAQALLDDSKIFLENNGLGINNYKEALPNFKKALMYLCDNGTITKKEADFTWQLAVALVGIHCKAASDISPHTFVSVLARPSYVIAEFYGDTQSLLDAFDTISLSGRYALLSAVTKTEDPMTGAVAKRITRLTSSILAAVAEFDNKPSKKITTPLGQRMLLQSMSTLEACLNALSALGTDGKEGIELIYQHGQFLSEDLKEKVARRISMFK